MPKSITRGFADTAKSGREGALRGAPAFGSPAAGVTLTEASSYNWLDRVSDLADNATGVINAVKGAADPKPAAAVDKPKQSALGGLNPTILIGAALLIAAVLYFRK